MGFQQGLSGLNAASKDLEVIGNNVANSSTVGFKQSQAQFADVYASSLTGAGSSLQVGIGTKVTNVAQQFTQGNITSSNNPLDIAINGGGFFRLSNNGTISYSRNGQFQLDKNGFITNSDGLHVTGYTANSSGVLSTGAPTDISISTADLPPKITSKVGAVLNLNSGEAVPTTTPFNIADPTTYNQATSVSVYDSLGNSHILQTFYVKTASNTWDVYASADGTAIGAPTVQGTLAFDSAGALSSGSPFSVAVPVTTGAATPLSVSVDYTGTTQFGSTFSVNALTQDGYTSGKLTGFNTGSDGVITGRYTNGQSATLGQVVLANFADPNGLQPLGNNTWAETAASGTPLVGSPGSGPLGVLQSSATEDSNVDLTAELVNMITAQRNYQANAQTIKTEDQVMQTLVNLR
ncbi:flagellar hook protein FlgE [Sulfuriferula nivalis]|uniref:Flagellar hook protein FlgE n=1 Tax=Sulfuriferula nivalis TaxID=2675298 RepID=A0A809S9G8_9PROT|nr:flagellar hook protein FlgE [Sulfuriferula nivalis]BBP01243.1 flagellar hook protein FlgE [Sulfuriferula nivalis]